MGGVDPGGEEGRVGAGGVQEGAEVEEGVEDVDCAGAVAEEGDVVEVEVLDEGADDFFWNVEVSGGVMMIGWKEKGTYQTMRLFFNECRLALSLRCQAYLV